MARYEHLQIYKKAMDLTIHFEKIVRNLDRYHKPGWPGGQAGRPRSLPRSPCADETTHGCRP